MKLPKYVSQYFWGDDLSELVWKDHQKYIMETILENGDIEAVSWLLKKVGKQKLKNQLPSLKLSHKSANFWRLVLNN